jgi:hypothetical protein
VVPSDNRFPLLAPELFAINRRRSATQKETKMKLDRSKYCISALRLAFKSKRPSLSALFVTSTFAGLVLAQTSVHAGGPDNVNPQVLPPNSHPRGRSYAEWSAAYWQWNSALPIDQNPNFDGENCMNGANGQAGPVWFLGGGVGIFPVVRNCEVPLGKAVFFQLLAGECSTLESPPFYGANEPELRVCAETLADLMTNIACEVDGVALQGLVAYRFQSPVFQIVFPPDNVAGVPGGGTGLSVGDGWYVLLAPLSKGQHTIHVHGEVPTFFVQDITYHLTVD